MGTLGLSLGTRGRLQRGTALGDTLPLESSWGGRVEMALLTRMPVLCPQNARSEALLAAAWEGTACGRWLAEGAARHHLACCGQVGPLNTHVQGLLS